MGGGKEVQTPPLSTMKVLTMPPMVGVQPQALRQGGIPVRTPPLSTMKVLTIPPMVGVQPQALRQGTPLLTMKVFEFRTTVRGQHVIICSELRSMLAPARHVVIAEVHPHLSC